MKLTNLTTPQGNKIVPSRRQLYIDEVNSFSPEQVDIFIQALELENAFIGWVDVLPKDKKFPIYWDNAEDILVVAVDITKMHPMVWADHIMALGADEFNYWFTTDPNISIIRFWWD